MFNDFRSTFSIKETTDECKNDGKHTFETKVLKTGFYRHRRYKPGLHLNGFGLLEKFDKCEEQRTIYLADNADNRLTRRFGLLLSFWFDECNEDASEKKKLSGNPE